MSGSTRDHAFITFSRTDMTRKDVLKLLSENGAEGGMIAMETHSLKPIESMAMDAHADELCADTEISENHIHAAVFGNFRCDRLARALHKAIGGKHCNVLFQHPPKKDAKRGAMWPFADMLDYLTDPAKQKEIDTDPLLWPVENVPELIQDYDQYVSRMKGSDLFVELKRMKDDGKDTSEAILCISRSLDKDNSYMYRVWKDYWDHVPRTPVKTLPDGYTAKSHQQRIIDWARQPVTSDTNGRGLWLNWPANKGKSWLLEMLRDEFGGDIFYPGVRPNGWHDMVSMMSYGGQKLILFDDVGASVDDDGEARWKGTFLNLIKRLCDVTPLAIDFGGRHVEMHVKARVIITSNFGIPVGRTHDETEAIHRRYIYEDGVENRWTPHPLQVPQTAVG